MKVLCNYVMGNGEKCNVLIHTVDDGNPVGVMYSLCEIHRSERGKMQNRKVDILRVFERHPVVDKVVLVRNMSMTHKDAEKYLRLLHDEHALSKGRAEVFGYPKVDVYTLLGTEEKYHGQSTMRFKNIDMGLGKAKG